MVIRARNMKWVAALVLVAAAGLLEYAHHLSEPTLPKDMPESRKVKGTYKPILHFKIDVLNEQVDKGSDIIERFSKENNFEYDSRWGAPGEYTFMTSIKRERLWIVLQNGSVHGDKPNVFYGMIYNNSYDPDATIIEEGRAIIDKLRRYYSERQFKVTISTSEKKW